ncbi:MAG: DUF6049 family protein [Actinomyces sp.]|uniref:DUF6049 family protein n=1 Tax=Actinomyces sp. TaxID=29317 RepID=UPI0025D4B26A|nr:DUF6049 family protein [Actinomyces sp.]MDU1430193.1 DUF6049 family protein [Actinomyces sp.]
MTRLRATRIALTLVPLGALLLSLQPANASTLASLPTAGTHEASAASALPATLAPQSSARPEVLGEAPQALGVDVRINRLEPRVITAQNNVQVSGVVRNLTDKPIQNPSLDAYVQTYSPLTASDLSAYLTGKSYQGRRVHAGTLEATIQPGAEQTFHMTIPFEDLPFTSDFEWGPRGITVVVEGDENRGSDRSILIWDSAYSLERTRVNVLLPWTSSTPRVTSDSYSILSAASMSGVTFATDSQTLVDELTVPEDRASSSASSSSPTPSASSSEASASASATSAAPSPSSSATPRSEAEITADRNTRVAFLQTFFERTRELVALPSNDADLTLATTLDNDTIMKYLVDSRAQVPTTLAKTQALLPSSSRSSASASASASASSSVSPSEASQSPSPSPSTEASPTQSSTAAPKLIDNVSWTTSGSWGKQSLNGQLGSTFIAPPGELAPESEQNFTSMAKVQLSADGQTITNNDDHSGESYTALSSLSPMTDLLSWDAQSLDDELDTQQFLTAMTAMITRERPSLSRTLFVPLQRSSSLDETRLERVRAILDNRWVEGISFSDLMNSEATDIERTAVQDSPFSDSLRSEMSALSGAYAGTLPLAGATENVDAARLRVDATVSSALRADLGDQRSETIVSSIQSLNTFSSSVSVESSNAVNLINKSANFPVRVRNSLPWPVNVEVTLLPGDPRLRVTSTSTATIPANSSSTVEVPVTAIGSGDIRVTYKVSTPSGTVLDDSQRVLVRMRAGWEDAATVVMAVLVGLAFVGGIIRTVRRRFKAATTEESSHLPGVGGVEKGTVNVPLSTGAFVKAGRPPAKPTTSDSHEEDQE